MSLVGSSASRRRGFGLLEVIVAFLILTLGLLALTRSTAIGARSSAVAQARQGMLQLAAGLMDRALAEDPTLLTNEGRSDRLAWRIETRPASSRNSDRVVRRMWLEEITVTVEDPTSGRDLRLQQTRLRSTSLGTAASPSLQ